MSREFDDDLARLVRLAGESRDRLLALLMDLGPADLDRGSRGGWDVRAVLQHVIQAEVHYASLVDRLRGKPEARPGQAPELFAATVPDLASHTPADVRGALLRSRALLLSAVEGVDEETFYRLGGGSQQYSVLSVLENVAQHDDEHAAQVRSIRDAARG